MTYSQPCITNVLPDIPSCTWPDGDPRTATRGEVCERCYEQIDHAIATADQLRALDRTLHGPTAPGPRLAGDGYARAITPQPGPGSIPGPRIPLTPLQLDLDAINRAQNGHHDPTDWVQTETGAAQAVRFARYVTTAEKAHPTLEQPHKLQRTRCPDCKQLAFVWNPPTDVGDPVTVECQNPTCGRSITQPQSLETMAHIEATAPDPEKQTAAFLANLRRQKKPTPGTAA